MTTPLAPALWEAADYIDANLPNHRGPVTEALLTRLGFRHDADLYELGEPDVLLLGAHPFHEVRIGYRNYPHSMAAYGADLRAAIVAALEIDASVAHADLLASAGIEPSAPASELAELVSEALAQVASADIEPDTYNRRDRRTQREQYAQLQEAARSNGLMQETSFDMPEYHSSQAAMGATMDLDSTRALVDLAAAARDLAASAFERTWEQGPLVRISEQLAGHGEVTVNPETRVLSIRTPESTVVEVDGLLFDAVDLLTACDVDIRQAADILEVVNEGKLVEVASLVQAAAAHVAGALVDRAEGADVARFETVAFDAAADAMSAVVALAEYLPIAEEKLAERAAQRAADEAAADKAIADALVLAKAQVLGVSVEEASTFQSLSERTAAEKAPRIRLSGTPAQKEAGQDVADLIARHTGR